ncbi:class E sortase [Kitasatospora sp. RB6PN24]|uniref:class E sortase n=1 Tax=Kitasatospora humi TaxID=2893891 RepID=UPI001E4D617D|nr:class E sortase [Kitasatospora humi]MCC9308015.1 class E sortase [Kitasatospora humi]
MAQQPAGSTRLPRRRSPTARVLGLAGELLVTLGVVLALFVAYSLWWTDLLADRQADQDGRRLRGSWTVPGDAAPAGLDAGGIGFLHVPAMGRGYSVLIKLGTDPAVLNQGVAGVYTQPFGPAMPWDPSGNFALAAHRDGHGARFHDLDAVSKGDPIVVETRDHWYVYRVDAVLDRTTEDDVGVVAPVPAKAGYTKPGRYITLTTCTPVYTSEYRTAVWGSLVRVDPVDAKRTLPGELR